MDIVLNNTKSKYSEVFSLVNMDNIHKTFRNFFSIKGPVEAKIFSINAPISIHELSKLKNHFVNLNVFSLCIYSNDRDTILAGKSLRIDSIFLQEQEVKKKLHSFNRKEKEDILHKGTVRSGDRLSSNGNLCIIGDVNPGAIVSAKKNIYVWGKLLGIAFAGKTGNNNASISSLYLNPLQLRIADVIAIGPKDKPHNYYPEIAFIDKQTIIIKPHIIETIN
tara:strand:- start:194 stop:856 length:663 start_codon:yes stop_codon:yes gene_type:complete